MPRGPASWGDVPSKGSTELLSKVRVSHSGTNRGARARESSRWIPAFAGMTGSRTNRGLRPRESSRWIPAFAGMTGSGTNRGPRPRESSRWIPAFAGMTGGAMGSPFQMHTSTQKRWIMIHQHKLDEQQIEKRVSSLRSIDTSKAELAGKIRTEAE